MERLDFERENPILMSLARIWERVASFFSKGTWCYPFRNGAIGFHLLGETKSSETASRELEDLIVPALLTIFRQFTGAF